MRFILTTLLLSIALPTLAQTPDTTSAWRYLPLQVGNVWEYAFLQEDYGVITGTERWVADRVAVVDGKEYVVIHRSRYITEGEPPEEWEWFVRFDTLAAWGSLWYDGEEAPFPRLRGEQGDCRLDIPFFETCGEWEYNIRGGYNQAVGIGVDTYNLTLKIFEDIQGFTAKSSQFSYFYSSFIAGVGYQGFEYSTNRFAYRSELTYARVNGVEYGTAQHPVTAEGALELAAVALAVFPNPGRGTATVRFTLDQPQHVTLAVYDVLGRRLVSHDLGAQPADEATYRLDLAALPAGLYVVRLDGDAGAAATARIVRH